MATSDEELLLSVGDASAENPTNDARDERASDLPMQMVSVF